MVGPVRGFLKRGFEHPFADLRDKSRFLSQWDEPARRNRAARRVIPAHQRLKSRNFLARRAHDGLIRDPQLVALDRLSQVVFENLLLRSLAVHRGLIEAML